MPEIELRGRIRPRIAITIGDINGVGPEVILKCLADRRILKFFVPVVIGPLSILQTQATELGLNDLEFHAVDAPSDCDKTLTPGEEKDLVVQVVEPIKTSTPQVRIGQITEAAGRIAMSSVAHATDLCLEGKVDAMVTAPISKEAIAMAGFNVPGHTEFIAARSNTGAFTMMMVADKLRVGLVTAHVPVSRVSEAITPDAIGEKLRIIGESLVADFGVSRPRIAVLGLNPHAGDGGVIGTEERDFIIPAILQSRSEGRLAYGPFAADGFFGSRNYMSFDAVLAMYHDQGLAPFKVLSFNSGVNFTAGLPIVRTSPDHGTAFNIAGKNQATPDSMRNAIYAAIDISRRRSPGGLDPHEGGNTVTEQPT